MSTTISRMVAKTPSTRDRYVDFLRALSIGVVVFGHWLMAIVYFNDGKLSGDNALEVIPGVWALTWILQVMPLFFFVGGFSNATSLASRKGSLHDWLTGRMSRLLRPTVFFVGAWMISAAALEVFVPTFSDDLAKATRIIAKPLWFLAVYVFVVPMAPLMLKLHRRFGFGVLVTLVGCAVAVDILRLNWLEAIGYLNFAFIWLFAHQLGFFYEDGSLVRLGQRAHSLMAIGGLITLFGLTQFGPYAQSMVGGGRTGASNNTPPSICLIALTVWLAGLAMLARPVLTRWLNGRRAWSAVIAANAMIMTVFLWHLTALLVVSITILPTGFPQPDAGSGAWWALRPVWILMLSVFLVPFVFFFGRFERPRARARQQSSGSPFGTIKSATAILMLTLSLGGFATAGFANLADLGSSGTFPYIPPAACALALVAGSVLLRSRYGVIE